MADNDNVNEEETTTVADIEKAYHDQIVEAWDNSYQNPENYDSVRKILDDLGL